MHMMRKCLDNPKIAIISRPINKFELEAIKLALITPDFTFSVMNNIVQHSMYYPKCMFREKLILFYS